jgi:hypothetical protein
MIPDIDKESDITISMHDMTNKVFRAMPVERPKIQIVP